MYTTGSNLMISIENLPAFKTLLDDAQEKGEQLRKALNALSQFELVFSFSVQQKNQAGDIEAASGIL